MHTQRNAPRLTCRCSSVARAGGGGERACSGRCWGGPGGQGGAGGQAHHRRQVRVLTCCLRTQTKRCHTPRLLVRAGKTHHTSQRTAHPKVCCHTLPPIVRTPALPHAGWSQGQACAHSALPPDPC